MIKRENAKASSTNKGHRKKADMVEREGAPKMGQEIEGTQKQK